MHINNLSWLSSHFTPHTVSEVILGTQEIQDAYTVAQQKVFHTNVYDPSGKTRAHAEMLSRLVAGELADRAVLELLNTHFQQNSMNCVAEEYDSVRTDRFVDTSPYSIHIKRNGEVDKYIEVRSSFCYRIPRPDTMISKLSMYGWYTSYGKPQEDPKDLYFQVFYHLRPQSVPKKDSWPDIEVFEDCLAKGAVVAYVVGGAERQLLERKGQTKTDAEGAFYKAIYPANEGRDINAMYKMC